MENSNQLSLMNFSERVQDEDQLLKFYVLTNDDGEMSKEMKIAHQALLDKIPLKRNILPISVSECLKFKRDEPTLEIFIMDKFEGEAFQHIEKMKTIYILGVKAICTVLYEQINIPDQYHFHNLSMKNFFICFSSISDRKEKNLLIKLVHYMGGIYSNSLKEITTHLVTEDIFSAKYFFANKHKMKIMKPEWIREYWNMHQDINFNNGPDHEMFATYKLPMFYGITASSTGIDVATKKYLMDSIESNGGDFSQTFKTAIVNCLFMTPKDIDSTKGKAAIKFKIKCVRANWVKDSVAAGYALPLNENYLITPTLKASTPTKDATSLDKFHFDNTMLSDITSVNASSTRHLTFEETQRSSRIGVSSKNLPILKRQITDKSIMSNGNASNRLAAKSFGGKDDTFKKPQLLRATKSTTVTTIRSTTTHYEKENVALKPHSDDEDDESFIQFLAGSNVYIYGYAETTDFVQIMKECEKLGANIVDASYNKTVDYIITPSNLIDAPVTQMKHKLMVNDLFLEDSVSEGKCVEMQFYYNPVFMSHPDLCDILRDELFVLSTYTMERERPYIKLLISAMGGRCNEALNKNEEAILLCPAASGKKFEGALKWNFTVLKAEWLYECYKHNMRYDETQFLVGATQPSKRNKKNQRESIIPFSQGTPTDNDSDDIMVVENNVDYAEKEAVLPKRVIELRPRNVESPKTPKTPKNDKSFAQEEDDGILSISDLVAEFPTPQRILTKAAILEENAKNKISPRAQRQQELLKTPGATQKHVYDESSPMPQLPDLMLPPPGKDFSIRPDSSPDSQWFWKMKMDMLDDQYVPRSDSLKKALRDDVNTTPYANKRYNFFKRCIPNYDSPDPAKKDNNGNNQMQASVAVNMQEEAANFLNFDESQSPVVKRNADDLLRLLRSGSRELSQIAHSSRDINARKQLDLDDEVLADKKVVWAVSTQIYEEEKKRISFGIEPINENEEASEMCIDENYDVHSSAIEIHEEQESSVSPAALDSSGDEIDFLGGPQQSEVNDYDSESFMFAVSSGNSNEEKSRIMANIIELGGKIDENNFKYLVMPKLAKSSKYFCALARGNFIIHPDFVKDSMLARKFLNPEDYEYGSPKLKSNISTIKAAEEVIRGPYICRQAILMNAQKYRNGLFTGMKFLIVATPEKREIFSFVITTGGGVIIDEQPEFKTSILKREKIDYCLVDHPNSLDNKNQKTLHACDIVIRNVRFIYEYLLSENLLA